MNAPAAVECLSFFVRVNGIEFAEVAIRSCGEQANDFEVMIRDHHLGSFALHEEFVLEIPDSNHAIPGWRPVSFSELMSVIWTAALMLRLDVVTDTISHLSQSHCRMERIPVEGDSSHIDRLHSSLQRARIGYQVVGGLDSLGRGRGHLTVAVTSLFRAVTSLRRAGFLENPESKYLLVDSRTGWKVRLLEGCVPRPNCNPTEGRRA